MPFNQRVASPWQAAMGWAPRALPFCRRVEGAQITMAGLVPISQGNGPRNSTWVEPQNYWLATPGCRVTTLSPVTPSSPATLVHQHPVSLLSPGKTLKAPRACPDPHSKGFHKETSQRSIWAHSTCLSAQTTSYGLSWSKTLWAPLCKGQQNSPEDGEGVNVTTHRSVVRAHIHQAMGLPHPVTNIKEYCCKI